MKFLCNTKKNKIDESFKIIFNYKILKKYSKFNYILENRKNRKNISNVRPGVSSNPKKNSIKRDRNFNLFNQLINLNSKKGKKLTVFKSFSIMFENFLTCLSLELDEFKRYNNFENLANFFNKNPEYLSFNNLLTFSTAGLESIFEIKASKNKKKSKSKSKYFHEIVYIPKERRLKYVLKALSFYKEQFKKYDLWERLFWCLIMVLLNKENSFLKKRRDYIYLKSIKFFKKKPKKN